VSAHQFVLEIGRAMHALGSPSYRVEDTMDACCRALGLHGSFFSTPTAIMAGIGEPGEEPRTSLLRVEPGDHDLARLAELYAVRDEVLRGELTPAEGLACVRAVLLPRRARPFLDIGAIALAGAAAAVLFGGGPRDIVVAGAAGVLVGVLTAVSRLRPALGDVQAPLACALVAFVVNLVASSGVGIDTTVTTVSAIVVLLPGLSFTSALAELAMRHLASGSSRLMGALAVLLTMTIGIGIGDRCANALLPAAPHRLALPLTIDWHLLAIGASAVAYVVLLRAARNQVLWILAAVAIGYGGARLGREVLGLELGAFVGAVAVAAAANLFARWRRQPAAVVRTPGLLLLVPGSLGLRGLRAALEHPGDPTGSTQGMLQMLMVGGAIVAGLLIAGVVAPPPLDVEPESRRLR
jgi:uncharacterized membrane protein YjjP (DUF1212 family)